MKRGGRAGIGWLCGHLVILIAAYAAFGCADPIGSIGDARSADELKALPLHATYTVGEFFDRNTDLEVYTLYQGVEESIPVSQVTIGIAENPDNPDVLEYVPKNNPYKLQKEGEKRVVVEYNGMTAKPYFIRVGAYNGGGGGGGGGNGGGIIIEWAE